jgi:TPR repeat protein
MDNFPETYFKARNQGDAEAQYQIGIVFNGGIGLDKNEDEAIYWFKKSADGNYYKSFWRVGFYYRMKENFNLAFILYEKGAERGCCYAQCSLGYFYSNGLGTAVNFEKAVYWFQKSVEAGNAVAMNNLGMMYEFGQYLEKNIIKAYELYLKSAMLNNDTAMLNLSIVLTDGEIPEDKHTAREWLILAKELGNKYAVRWLEEYFPN